MKKRQNKIKIKKLNIAAIAVIIIAVIVMVFKFYRKNGDAEIVSSASQMTEAVSITPEVTDDKIVIDATILSKKVSFFNYNASGTNIQFMLLKTDDERVRCALNTCQVCNGSPYAYFEQIGNVVICQNCGNQFALTQIGDEHGGCNPVPLEFTQESDNVVIDTAVLDSYAAAFTNWKKSI